MRDDAPLFADVNASYRANLTLLEKMKAASLAITLDLDGVSIKSGYFFYLYMKLFRRAAEASSSNQTQKGQVLRKNLSKALKKCVLPARRNGVLRIDFPVDLYEEPGGFWNKNIDVSGTSIIMAVPEVPAFIPKDHPKIGQVFDIAALLSVKTYRWGFEILDALDATGLEISRWKFWPHHLVYCSRLSGFATLFGQLFSRNSFEQVHFCRFSEVSMQGMLLAARKNRVHTVEYQHGVISKMHPAVVLMDQNAISTTPDVLKITSSIYCNVSYGNAVVELVSISKTSNLAEPMSLGRGVLIAMQPRFADEAVQLAKRLANDFPNIFFTLRSHPRAQPQSAEIAEIQAFDNLVFERAAHVESSVSLNGRDGHITGSSTMGLTAAVCGIPSLFLHREGFDQAKQLLGSESTGFTYAETYADTRSWLLSVQPK